MARAEHPLRVGDLLIDGPLAFGRVSSLYLARHVWTAERSDWRGPTWLGCKLVAADLARAPGLYEAMVEVFRRAAVVSSPHIELVHSIAYEEVTASYRDAPVTELTLVCEVVRGLSLRAMARSLRHRQRPMDASVVLGLMLQLAEGLAAAHAHPGGVVVHGGLAPARIRVTPEGVVKIVDFGLVPADAPAAMRTNSQPTEGLLYQAPDRFEGEGRTPAPSDDLWSLGAIVWGLFSARPLFRDRDFASSLERWRGGAVPRLSTTRDDLPAGLDERLQVMLAKDPRARQIEAQGLVGFLRGLEPRVAGPRAIAAWLVRELHHELAEERQRFERCVASSPHLAKARGSASN